MGHCSLQSLWQCRVIVPMVGMFLSLTACGGASSQATAPMTSATGGEREHGRSPLWGASVQTQLPLRVAR